MAAADPEGDKTKWAGDSNILVVVRCRPLSENERKAREEEVVRVSGAISLFSHGSSACELLLNRQQSRHFATGRLRLAKSASTSSVQGNTLVSYGFQFSWLLLRPVQCRGAGAAHLAPAHSVVVNRPSRRPLRRKPPADGPGKGPRNAGSCAFALAHLNHARDAYCRPFHVLLLQVVEGKQIVIKDPGHTAVNEMRKKRMRDRQYAFDHSFDSATPSERVYAHTTKHLIDGVVAGYNATVFAYGATGRWVRMRAVGIDPGRALQ